MTHGFTTRERRWLARKPKGPWHTRIITPWMLSWFEWFWIGICAGIIFFGGMWLGFMEGKRGAQTRVMNDLVALYPATNRGTCELARDLGLPVRGASREATKGRCAALGVTIK